MSTVLVDRSAKLRMSFSGEKAKESLGGLVTNDVVALRPGQGQRAIALTPKGRVISLLRVFDRGTDLLVDAEPESAEAFVAMIRKFVNPRSAKYTLLSEATACIGLHGPDAANLVAARTGIEASALEALAPLGIVRAPDSELDVIRSSELSLPGFEIVGERSAVMAIQASLLEAGIPTATPEQLETWRVETGLPRFGVEMDAETIPQEANLDLLGAISFNKGCYTGQEVVARIHFRGHVNRHLRWLSSAESLSRGAVVLDADGKEVGDVRSSVQSATRGNLAIAMVRREVAPGSEVRVRDGERELTAKLEAIA